jgi:hypothetical protein
MRPNEGASSNAKSTMIIEGQLRNVTVRDRSVDFQKQPQQVPVYTTKTKRVYFAVR